MIVQFDYSSVVKNEIENNTIIIPLPPAEKAALIKVLTANFKIANEMIFMLEYKNRFLAGSCVNLALSSGVFRNPELLFSLIETAGDLLNKSDFASSSNDFLKRLNIQFELQYEEGLEFYLQHVIH